MTRHVNPPDPAREGWPPGRPSRAGGLEGLVLVPNLIFVAIVVLYLVSLQSGQRVAPLVQGEKTTEDRIAELERLIRRDPGNTRGAIELARLYQTVGEFPWSYNALLNVEKRGSREPSLRLILGLAFLELGKNDDAIRVLKRTLGTCRGKPGSCGYNVTVKLKIFNLLARTFRQRGIDCRRHHAAAAKALHEILKPVKVDPDKMRPKAPAPAEEPTSRPLKKG